MIYILYKTLDENECKTSRPCKAFEKCINTAGSYKCVRIVGYQCPIGFRYRGKSCIGKGSYFLTITILDKQKERQTNTSILIQICYYTDRLL